MMAQMMGLAVRLGANYPLPLAGHVLEELLPPPLSVRRTVEMDLCLELSLVTTGQTMERAVPRDANLGLLLDGLALEETTLPLLHVTKSVEMD